jgi:monoamine oxidase
MKAAIDAAAYASAVKFGVQFSRRFWEEDEQIFGALAGVQL